MSAILNVQNLGKQYRISHTDTGMGYYTLREEIANRLSTLAGRFTGSIHQRHGRTEYEIFWAVKEMNFELKAGERLGIIGSNGAGKSTLLKLLSRITVPSTGRITIRGRIASLLEVGTGFHPELTGRENIYLNGAVLGMSREEIRRKFDEIVSFSQIEKFLDTPVKRYSSGMYVRLAFAIAAHLEPEILIVDEVLAVGDFEFQKKCLGRMENISDEGRTIILVSHNMATIERICNRCIYIDKGKIKLDASPKESIAAYYNKTGINNQTSVDLLKLDYRGKSTMKLFKKIELINEHQQPVNKIQIGGYLKIIVELQENIVLDHLSFGFGIESESGERLFSSTSLMQSGKYLSIDTSVSNKIEFTLKNVNLMPGQYSINIAAVKSQQEFIDSIDRAIAFEIISSDIYGTGKLPTTQQGNVYMPSELQII